MNVPLVEFRKLLAAGQRYLTGSCSIQELHGLVAELATVGSFFQSHPAIITVARDWIAVIDRRWNECNHHTSPLSECVFRAWLEGQLLQHHAAEA
jgi:hypothetical protein